MVVTRDPGATAILAPGRTPLTYAGLSRHVASVGATLAALGINRHDRVALVLPNGPTMATTFLGVTAWAICAPLNPQSTADELAFYLTDLRPAAIVIDETLDSPARDVARRFDVRVLEVCPDPSGVAGITMLDGIAPVADPLVPIPPRPDDLALLLHTSGTTSRPKLVPLTHANITASAHNVADTLQLAPADRCLNLMPLFHIHGLVAALLASLTSGASVVCTTGFEARNVLDWIRELEPTWYTAVPTIHRAMVDAVSDSSIKPGFRFIRSSSAALPLSLLADIERTFGVPVIEAYGMTEAAHQIASNPVSTALRKPGTVGPAAGPELAIMDDDGHMLGRGAVGEIVIRGSNVMSGYLQNEAANAIAFTDGWFHTGDLGSLDDDGYLTISGRLKEIINRAGEKVAPSEVEEALLAHPDVTQAVAFAIPHPRLGEEVGAAVALRDGSLVSQGELRRFVAERLAQFKVPRRVVFVDDIPKGPTGKVLRLSMRAHLGLETVGIADADGAIIEPRNEAERTLTRIFADVLDLDRPVSVTDDFFELGADSLHLEELRSAIDAEFHRPLAATMFLSEVTPARLGEILHEDPVAGTIVPIQPDGSRPPLFCVMRADALVTARHFIREFGTDQPIFGISMPGMHGPVDGCASIERIGAACCLAVTEVQPSGPYYLFGHSLGGLVVYEMARQFGARGESVNLVVMADTPYPENPRFRDYLRRFCSREGPSAVARRLHDVAGLVRARVRARYRKPAGRGKLSERATSERSVDFRAVMLRERHYVRRARPSTAPVALLRTRDTMERHCGGAPALRWEPYVTDSWEIHEIPGSHDSLLGEPYVRVLAATLAACMLRAQEQQ